MMNLDVWSYSAHPALKLNSVYLQLLFHSAHLTGNETLRQIAISHSDHTMVNHVRPDGLLIPYSYDQIHSSDAYATLKVLHSM